MKNRQETPKEKRERLRQLELNKNPGGALRDGFSRGENGNYTDITGGMGWKGTVILIVVLIVGFVLYKLFLK
ncbi:DUF6366 family protein [Psychrobacillus sp. FSL K6-2684]|uniref:DUF6366 family protein n=1 Tax=unclassified Psychrobacillus TaxID=2636677 RepID=UPI001244D46E|nr:DUF6366 family protein [Psychrobacillus sp. AK 1817]QEY22606.1 hypothetical protein D0S48_19235 [Psychrobacillus sp. AK 1817]